MTTAGDDELLSELIAIYDEDAELVAFLRELQSLRAAAARAGWELRELLQFALPIVRASDYQNLAADIERALASQPAKPVPVEAVALAEQVLKECTYAKAERWCACVNCRCVKARALLAMVGKS